MTDLERIPFQVDINRVIEVLATQIYQSPLALLRENAQNAFDAILLRRYRHDDFEPRIAVRIEPLLIAISDNGVGMTADDLRNHYWRAGSSSKNSSEARAAGVVGTFGIGAMANFGIADELLVETESGGERTRSRAIRATLSATEDCIELVTIKPTGHPGTEVTATISASSAVDVSAATAYLQEFVGLADVNVEINGVPVKRHTSLDLVPLPKGAKPIGEGTLEVATGLKARISVQAGSAGELHVRLDKLRVEGEPETGSITFLQGRGAIQTYRSGFGLATVSVGSAYSFGGIADLRMLEPTAGREALSTGSMQLLQQIVSTIDLFVSEKLASRAVADENNAFMEWVAQHGRWDLCGMVKIRREPGKSVRLRDLKGEERPWLTYHGSDNEVINAHATEDRPLLIAAARNPRRQCQLGFLQAYCQTETVTDSPQLLQEKPAAEWSVAESATVFRIIGVLESDYFLPADIRLGRISHGIPILVEGAESGVVLMLDPGASTFQVLTNIFESEYEAFGSVVKDFVRTIIFPKVAEFVPSSTRQGAESFLRTIQRHREVFEYEWADLGDLTSIWSDYLEGRLSMQEAAQRSSVVAARNVQVVDSNATQTVSSVVPDVLENARVLGDQEEADPAKAFPAISRREIQSDAKLLTIPPDEPALRGYRAFIALAERAREQRGEFFLDPHRTSVVWGGQKVVFIFQHHSGRVGLYYDIQTPALVAAESGGRAFPTCTLILKNRIFIPIPTDISGSFMVEEGERKRFEVRCDLLYTEREVFDQENLVNPKSN